MTCGPCMPLAYADAAPSTKMPSAILDASIEVASGEAKIRVEVPLIKAFDRRHYVTIERTWAALLQDDMILRVPLMVRAQLPRLERRRAGEARVTGGGRQEDGREPCAG